MKDAKVPDSFVAWVQQQEVPVMLKLMSEVVDMHLAGIRKELPDRPDKAGQ